jgi:tripartite-type tricarboxylate transporter receptor subunit TctC
MPELPTVAESGLPGFEVALRYGLIAPAGTPRPIIERLNKELRAALDSDEVRTRLATEGAEPLPSSPAEYATDIDQEETKWAALIKRIGVKGQ